MSTEGGKVRPECQQRCGSKHCTHKVSDGLGQGHLCCLLVKNLICLCFAHALKTEGGCVEKEGITDHQSIRLWYGHYWMHLTRFVVRAGSSKQSREMCKPAGNGERLSSWAERPAP